MMTAINETVSRLRKPSDIQQPEPYPVSMWPKPVADLIREGAAAMRCDSSMIAMPITAAIASMIGGSRFIALSTTWREFPIFWTAVVAESGSKKSPAHALGISPIIDIQDDELERHAEAMEVYEAELADYHVKLKRWEKKDGNLDTRPIEPIKPTTTRRVTSDATIEAIAPILKDNPRGILVAIDELSGWFRGFDSYKARAGADAPRWLTLHNGGTLIVDRKGQGLVPLYIKRAMASLTGTIQPAVLVEDIGKRMVENGCAARLLVSMPKRTVSKWSDADVTYQTLENVRRLCRVLSGLKMNPGDDGRLEPIAVHMSHEAKRAFVQWHDQWQEDAACLTGMEASCWQKTIAHAARYALVIHMIRGVTNDPNLTDPNTIDQQSMACAIQLARWGAHEWRRVFTQLQDNELDRQLRSTLESISAKGGEITPRDLSRSSSRFRDVDHARSELHAISGMGFGRMETRQTGKRGGRPSEVFVLHPDAGGKSVFGDKENER